VETIASLQRWWSPRVALDASPELREKVAGLAALGHEHLLAARSAVDQRLPAAAASLYGCAILRFSEARSLAVQPEPGKEGASSLDPAGAVIASGAGVESTERGADALLLLREPHNTGTLGAGRRRRALALLDDVSARLGAALGPASDAEVRSLRIRRRATVIVLSLLASAAFGHWLVSPRNVARGKPVTASSIRFGSPQALVNGAIEWGSFGLHTGGSGREWATIDLQKFYELDHAEIYSRGEGRFEFNLPLRVELSDDGATFRDAGACTELFTQTTPCLVDLHHQRARYVRVSASEVVLAEVEVYGKP
jgi:hypothetical protein